MQKSFKYILVSEFDKLGFNTSLEFYSKQGYEVFGALIITPVDIKASENGVCYSVLMRKALKDER